MAQQTGSKQETVADALARRVEARRGAASRWAEAFRELGAVDRAVYEVVARTPTPELDGPVRRLSDAANRSRLWLGIAAVIALLGGERGRRAALEGVVAIEVTSATVNLGVSHLPAGGVRIASVLTSLRPARYRCRDRPHFPPVMPRRRSRSTTPWAGTCQGWACRSGCLRVGWPTRASTPACITGAMW